MAYEKQYNEIYAVTLLKYFWSDYREGFIKWESPDWLHRDANLGVEVSQALLPRDGQEANFLEQYLGGHKSEIPDAALEKYGERLYFYNDRLWAITDDGTETTTGEEKILTRFSCKLGKLNNHYRHCKTNALYLYCHTVLTENMPRKIMTKLHEIEKEKDHRFDLVFLDCDDTIYILDFVKDQVDTIALPKTAQAFLHEKAETLRQTGEWQNGTPYH